MRNFAKMTMKFRLIQRKFAGALVNFRDERSLNFRENKGRNSANLAFNTLAQHCNYLTITSILALTITLGDTRSSKLKVVLLVIDFVLVNYMSNAND